MAISKKTQPTYIIGRKKMEKDHHKEESNTKITKCINHNLSFQNQLW
jgi:hypothetical protein